MSASAAATHVIPAGLITHTTVSVKGELDPDITVHHARTPDARIGITVDGIQMSLYNCQTAQGPPFSSGPQFFGTTFPHEPQRVTKPILRGLFSPSPRRRQHVPTMALAGQHLRCAPCVTKIPTTRSSRRLFRGRNFLHCGESPDPDSMV